MSYFAYDRMGASIRRPDLQTMRSLLASVFANDPEHPYVSLTDEEGWGMSYGFSRTLILENAETDEGPWHMKEVTPEQALGFWVLLSNGQLAELRSSGWVEGYGN
jgi:hypothetical protein